MGRSRAAEHGGGAGSSAVLSPWTSAASLLGSYEITSEVVGRGQFGTTYACIERSTGERCACKAIEKRRLSTSEDVEDVRREVAILRHMAGEPGIVRFKGAYEDLSHVYLVMELCAGGELFDRIIARGHYSERQARDLARAIALAVHACHSRGVFHRDLKPENFLFSTPLDDSPLKAIDFGLSVFFRPGQVFTDVVGSPYYVAPEVLRKSYGPEADIWSAGVILYILLSGVPPFWAETDRGIFEQVLKGVLDFDSDPWPQVSESAKDLIRNMLNPQPSQRFTALQVLSHPWMQEDSVAPDHSLGPAIIGRMKQFKAMNKMKRIALRVIAERLSEEEISGLKKMFKMMDTDNSGAITFDELKVGLEKLGSRLMDSEVQNILEAADIDNNGSIDYEEFITATLNLNKIEREDNLFAAFSYFDKDSSGYITVEELQQACIEHNMVDAEVEEIIREIDQNKDGIIDYSEFVAMMRKGNGGVGRRNLTNTLLRDDIMIEGL